MTDKERAETAKAVFGAVLEVANGTLAEIADMDKEPSANTIVLFLVKTLVQELSDALGVEATKLEIGYRTKGGNEGTLDLINKQGVQK